MNQCQLIKPWISIVWQVLFWALRKSWWMWQTQGQLLFFFPPRPASMALTCQPNAMFFLGPVKAPPLSRPTFLLHLGCSKSPRLFICLGWGLPGPMLSPPHPCPDNHLKALLSVILPLLSDTLTTQQPNSWVVPFPSLSSSWTSWELRSPWTPHGKNS